jgi:cytochrome c biogenesis protein CcmG/thiol:disulfide interchange protein DsbE
MSFRRRVLALVACLAALASANALAKQPVVGEPAPDFQARTLDGEKLTLADFKGQVLVLNFWATWCAPCRKELALLDSYYRIQEKTGLRVLAVSTEDSLQLGKLKAVAAALAIPMVRGFRGHYGPLRSMPTNFIIDRAGYLRYDKGAALTLDEMNAVLLPLLRENASPKFHGEGAISAGLKGT